jgi:hypothetical protein
MYNIGDMMRLNRAQLRNILLREAQYMGDISRTSRDGETAGATRVKGKDEDIGKKLDDISARLKKLEEMIEKMMGKDQG